MTYERGWGKKLSFVFSFSACEAVDVSRRYCADWTAALRRRGAVPEEWLATLFQRVNMSTQATLPDEMRGVIAARAQSEQRLLKARENAATHAAPLSVAERRGRQTGSAEWRRARGEMGGTRGCGGGSGGGGGGGSGGRVTRVCGALGDVVRPGAARGQKIIVCQCTAPCIRKVRTELEVSMNVLRGASDHPDRLFIVWSTHEPP